MPVPGRVRVKVDNGIKRAEKKYVRLDVGYQHSHTAPYVNNCVNFIHAVVCRAILVKREGIFQPRPLPAQQASYNSVLLKFRALHRFGPVWPTLSLAPLTRAQFVSGRPSRLRKIYENALNQRRFELRGLNDLARLKGFVKVEKSAQPYTTFDGEETARKAPRPIQPRDPAYNIELGRYTVKIEEVLFDDLAEICNFRDTDGILPVVMKCYNLQDRAEIMRRHWNRAGGDGRAIAIPLDQSGFDAHINELALNFEHEVYGCYFKRCKLLKRLLSVQLRNTTVAHFRDGTVKARLGAMRMSGDMTTSLGNCLISASLALMLVEPYANASFVVDGDDTILFIPATLVDVVSPLVVPHYLQFGFDAVAEDACSEFEHIEFCQTHPVFDGTNWRLVRNWNKAVSLDYSGYEKLLQDQYFLEFLHGVGSCGMALCHGIPIMQEFYSFGIANGIKPSKDRFSSITDVGLFRFANMAGGFRRWSPVTDAARLSFWKAFGVTPDSQIAWEERFKTMTLSFDVDDTTKITPASHILITRCATESPPLGILTIPSH